MLGITTRYTFHGSESDTSLSDFFRDQKWGIACDFKNLDVRAALMLSFIHFYHKGLYYMGQGARLGIRPVGTWALITIIHLEIREVCSR